MVHIPGPEKLDNGESIAALALGDCSDFYKSAVSRSHHLENIPILHAYILSHHSLSQS